MYGPFHTPKPLRLSGLQESARYGMLLIAGLIVTLLLVVGLGRGGAPMTLDEAKAKWGNDGWKYTTGKGGHVTLWR